MLEDSDKCPPAKSLKRDISREIRNAKHTTHVTGLQEGAKERIWSTFAFLPQRTLLWGKVRGKLIQPSN